MAKAAETYSTEAPECPYCGYIHRHDGGLFYDEDLTEFDCERCDRKFDIIVHTSTSWSCSPRDPTLVDDGGKGAG